MAMTKNLTTKKIENIAIIDCYDASGFKLVFGNVRRQGKCAVKVEGLAKLRI